MNGASCNLSKKQRDAEKYIKYFASETLLSLGRPSSGCVHSLTELFTVVIQSVVATV